MVHASHVVCAACGSLSSYASVAAVTANKQHSNVHPSYQQTFTTYVSIIIHALQPIFAQKLAQKQHLCRPSTQAWCKHICARFINLLSSPVHGHRTFTLFIPTKPQVRAFTRGAPYLPADQLLCVSLLGAAACSFVPRHNSTTPEEEAAMVEVRRQLPQQQSCSCYPTAVGAHQRMSRERLLCCACQCAWCVCPYLCLPSRRRRLTACAWRCT